jgi:hypothetical protein
MEDRAQVKTDGPIGGGDYMRQGKAFKGGVEKVSQPLRHFAISIVIGWTITPCIKRSER